MSPDNNQPLKPNEVLIASPLTQSTNQTNIPPQPNINDSYYSEEPKSFWQKIKTQFLDLFIFVAIAASIMLVVHKFVAEPHQVSGSSMVPNFKDGDFLITNKIATNYQPIHRGEIIIFTSPKDASKVFIKRVIGLPKDRVKILSGNVFLNDKKIDEPYLPQQTLTPASIYLSEGEEIVVPDNQYIVFGDNRVNSTDSREIGPIKKELIIGQAWLRYWPINKFGIIKHHPDL